MGKNIELRTIKDWEDFNQNKDGSFDTIIFKYSPICPISISVEGMFDEWLSNLSGEIKLNCIKINVLTSRQLSRKIAEDIKIKHESPQLIWLTSEGELKWTDSHYSITESKLNEMLNKYIYSYFFIIKSFLKIII